MDVLISAQQDISELIEGTRIEHGRYYGRGHGSKQISLPQGWENMPHTTQGTVPCGMVSPRAARWLVSDALTRLGRDVVDIDNAPATGWLTCDGNWAVVVAFEGCVWERRRCVRRHGVPQHIPEDIPEDDATWWQHLRSVGRCALEQRCGRRSRAPYYTPEEATTWWQYLSAVGRCILGRRCGRRSRMPYYITAEEATWWQHLGAGPRIYRVAAETQDCVTNEKSNPLCKALHAAG